MKPRLVLPALQAKKGHRILLAALQSHHGGTLRSLCCYDLETSSALWTREAAARIEGVLPLDLDGNGSPDFLCGSSALGNGYRTSDGTADDNHSYVFAFSDSGQKLWQRELSEVYSSAHVALSDADGDGRKETCSRTTTPPTRRSAARS